MKVTTTLLAFLVFSALAFSATIYVPDNYATIQGAIDASVNGDTVVVRAGTYLENINFIGKAITIKSELGVSVTTIDGNQAGSVVTFKSGESASSVLDGFTVTNGNATDGGGICCTFSSPTIINNTITGNAASGSGGGIFCDEFCLMTTTNNTIIGNTSTGTPYETGGGGFACSRGSSIIINNTILRGNSSATGSEIFIGSGSNPSTLTISYSNVEGGQSSCYEDSGCTLIWGPGMIDADPLFADDTNGDYHITWNSPCRDTGENSVVTELYDFEGDPRIAIGTVDMGADEYYYHLYHMGDVIPGFPIDIKVIGYPTAPVLLALGSGIQDPPLSTQYGDLWLNWPPLWQGNIGTVPGNGVKVFSATVPSAWTPGSEHPLQALVGPWGGPWTRLTNAEVLVVE